MKFLYAIPLSLLLLPSAYGADPVSIEKFKKMEAVEREKIIAQASIDQRDELIKIDIHLKLLYIYGEAGLQYQKEHRILQARGIGDLEEVFYQQWALVDSYYSQVLNGDVLPAMTKHQQTVAGRQLTNEKARLAQRNMLVHALVYKMAISPQALELTEQAKRVLAEMRPTVFDGHPVTKDVLNDVGRQLDEIFKKMKQLPMLSPTQLQKVYKEFPEVKVLRDDTHEYQ